MAIYRNIQMSFWTDPAVADDYTPRDKLFYLYVLTNPHTNLCGCYEVSIRQMANEIGYANKEIEELVDRSEKIHKTIIYDRSTKELLILRWSRYNWTVSEKFRKPLLREIQKIKNAEFKGYLMDLYEGADTVSIPYQYGTDTTVTVPVHNNIQTLNNIVDYLNSKCGTKYKANSETTRKHINARLAEGYTEDDFKTVIDKKYDEWHGTEQEKYLRPETLFGSKFEGYLNQKINKPKNKNEFNNFEQRDTDYDKLEAQLLQRTYGGGA